MLKFYERTERTPSGCWEWTGPRDRQGYGKVLGGKLAHRISYELSVGNPVGQCVLHICDNPPCINPEHLRLGTVGDNNRDASLKRRSPGYAGTHCVNGHEFTPENTYWRPAKLASRDCRACIRDRSRRYAARKVPVSV